MTLIDTGRRGSTDSAVQRRWEARWLRLAALEGTIASNAMKKLAGNGIPGGLSRGDLRSHVADVWEQIRHEACGAAGTGTMAERLNDYERDFAGPDLEAQTVAYIGSAVANRVRNVLTRSVGRTISYDELPRELVDQQLSVADQALGRVGFDDALAFITDELSPEAAALAGARASGITARDEQVVLTGIVAGRIKEASKELSAARVAILQRLATVIGTVTLPAATLRRWITPERAEAAAAAGSVGIGVKVTAGIAISAAIAVGALAGPLERSVHSVPPARARVLDLKPTASRLATAARAQTQGARAVATKAAPRTTTSGTAARRHSVKSVRPAPKASAAKREFAVAPTVSTSAALPHRSAVAASPAAKEFVLPTAKSAPKSAAAEEFK